MNIIFFTENIFTLSFLMSYAAVFGIMTAYKYFYIEKLPSYIASMTAVSLSAGLFINPIIIYNFGMINYLGIFAGFFILPVMPLVLIFCFTALILSIFNIRLDFVSLCMQISYDVILKISEFCVEFTSHLSHLSKFR